LRQAFAQRERNVPGQITAVLSRRRAAGQMLSNGQARFETLVYRPTKATVRQPGERLGPPFGLTEAGRRCSWFACDLFHSAYTFVHPVAVLGKIREYCIPLLSGGSADNDHFRSFRVSTRCGRVRIAVAVKTVFSCGDTIWRDPLSLPARVLRS